MKEQNLAEEFKKIIDNMSDEELNQTMDVGDENEFENWREEMLKELEKDPNYMNIEDEFQRFYQDNCKQCGSQRCTGVYDEVWREGCALYKKEFHE